MGKKRERISPIFYATHPSVKGITFIMTWMTFPFDCTQSYKSFLSIFKSHRRKILLTTLYLSWLADECWKLRRRILLLTIFFESLHKREIDVVLGRWKLLARKLCRHSIKWFIGSWRWRWYYFYWEIVEKVSKKSRIYTIIS